LGSVFPTLKNIRSKRAGLLSGGQRQMLSIEMASQQCGVLNLWDEPTAGLSEENVELALTHLTRNVARDTTQLIVEQRSDLLAGKVARAIQIDELVSRGDEDE
jgi:branched-chain amino acid transport system ATP-binding protein